MCGICGIVDFGRHPRIETVEAMNLTVAHRGPDAGAISSFDSCVMGHRRLSIQDLSTAANQPMLSTDGKVALVFNGEIYNFLELREDLERRGHRFRTRSDTEVILELYLERQAASPSDLNGMFSFAIWDDHKKKLTLVRDRVGKKPLYYCHRNGRLTFSSELYSLVQDDLVPRDLWNQGLLEFLLYDFIPAPHTIFKGVRKLLPGHMATFDASGLSIDRYWKLPDPKESMDYGDAKKQLEELLQDSVKRRLISDVPLGSFLSGGIDSTLVTSLMSGNSARKVRTFSISFPGTSHDESKWSSLAAGSIGTEHNEHPVNYEIGNIFSRIVRHFGEPFGDSSAIPTWYLSEHTRRSVTVALSGDGGDELFAGYERYLARRFQTIYDLIPRGIRNRIIEPFVESLPATTDYYGTSFSKKLKLFVDASRRIRDDPSAVVPRTFSSEDVRLLTGLEYEPDLDPVLEIARQWVGLDPVSRMSFTDIQTYMSEDILTKVDRMSMAHALEVRSPLLDYRVVELACRMPVGFKIGMRTTKKILRDVAGPYVPASILQRSKYGFQVPLGLWFKTDLKQWAEERLLGRNHDFFRKEQIEKIWHEHQTGRGDNAHKIWLLLVFGEWNELM